jgi:ribosomal protein S18 acetylase RimI-like enzyme
MTEPTIRLARPDDAGALAALAKATFCETFVDGFTLNYPEEDLRHFLEESYALGKVAAWINDPDGQVLVAERDGRLIGYVQSGINTLPCKAARAGDGELKRIYVSKSAQGLGLGRALLERALQWLGDRPIFIGVWSGNLKAQKLYGHYGFKVVDHYQFPVGETLDDEVIMGRA